MENISQTQLSNITAIAGFIILILQHYNIVITQDELITFIGGIVTIGSIGYNWYNRFSKGDVTIAGFRK